MRMIIKQRKSLFLDDGKGKLVVIINQIFIIYEKIKKLKVNFNVCILQNL